MIFAYQGFWLKLQKNGNQSATIGTIKLLECFYVGINLYKLHNKQYLHI
jgi:hypothetical protein